MSISALSRGFFSVGPVGKVLSPIVVDGITYLALRYLIRWGWPSKRWEVSILPALGALVLTSGISKFTIIAGLCYAAYKVCQYMWVVRFPKESYVHFGWNLRLTLQCPSPDDRQQHLSALALEQRSTIQQLFHNSETVQLADQEIQKAAEDMRNLYQELEKGASKVPEADRFRKMAIDLTTEGGSNFWHRFCCGNSKTLLDLYRRMRGLEFIAQGGNYGGVYFLLQLENEQQQLEDSQPFFTPPSHQSRWRETYNKIIDLFAPLMEELKKIPSYQQSEIQKSFLKWAVRDDEIRVAKDDDPNPQAFKLNPCSLPYGTIKSWAEEE